VRDFEHLRSTLREDCFSNAMNAAYKYDTEFVDFHKKQTTVLFCSGKVKEMLGNRNNLPSQGQPLGKNVTMSPIIWDVASCSQNPSTLAGWGQERSGLLGGLTNPERIRTRRRSTGYVVPYFEALRCCSSQIAAQI
jgi:hypothetical protein